MVTKQTTLEPILVTSGINWSPTLPNPNTYFWNEVWATGWCYRLVLPD